MSNNPRILPGRLVAVFTRSDARAVAEAAAGHAVPVHIAPVIDLAERRAQR